VGRDTVVIGEVGLTGEVRPVSQLGLRLKEAARLGFKRAVVPSASTRRSKQADTADIETLAVATLKEAWSRLGG
jgi:DNA repair protein RadA/Sms